MDDSKRQALKDLVKSIDLFYGLSNEEIKKVFAICTVGKYSKGTRIFSEGEIGDKFYIVVSGEVRIGKIIPRVGEEAFAFLRPGSYFGEMSLIDGSPRAAMATSEKDVTLLEIRNGDFVQLISEDDNLAKKYFGVSV